jgi:hypothetical protein
MIRFRIIHYCLFAYFNSTMVLVLCFLELINGGYFHMLINWTSYFVSFLFAQDCTVVNLLGYDNMSVYFVV